MNNFIDIIVKFELKSLHHKKYYSRKNFVVMEQVVS